MYFLSFFLSFPGRGTACFLLFFYCELRCYLVLLSFFLVGLFVIGGWLYCLCFDLLSLFLAFVVISWFPRPEVCLLTLEVFYLFRWLAFVSFGSWLFLLFSCLPYLLFYFFPWYLGVKAVLTFLILLLCTFGRFYLFWGCFFVRVVVYGV